VTSDEEYDEPIWGYRMIAAILRRGYGLFGQQEEKAMDYAGDGFQYEE